MADLRAKEFDSIVVKSNEVFDRLNHFEKFVSNGVYRFFNSVVMDKVLPEVSSFKESLPRIDEPKNERELIVAELNRRLDGAILSLEQMVDSNYVEFDKILSLLAIPEQDVKDLEGWLSENKLRVESIVKQLYEDGTFEYQLNIQSDVPKISKKMQEFADHVVKNYHKLLGPFIGKLTSGGEFLGDIDVTITLNGRSYYNPVFNTVALNPFQICFIDKKKEFNVNELALIRVYGHEVMGHALNSVLSEKSNLPLFLKSYSLSHSTLPTAESVAQFYEKIIFSDIKNDKEIQQKLGIADDFEEMYKKFHNESLLSDYLNNFNLYTIYVLADKSKGDQLDEKIHLIERFSFSKANAYYQVDYFLKNFVDHKGNLNPRTVSELKYCVKSAYRAYQEFIDKGFDYSKHEDRSIIDKTLLEGYWTPQGLEQKARLIASELSESRENISKFSYIL